MEISPGCSLEGLMLKLKLQYFGHLMRRANSLEKTLMLGKIEGRRRRGRQRMRWLDGITDSMDMRLGGSRSWWWTGRPGVLWFMGSQIVGHDWATELNWTETHILLDLEPCPVSPPHSQPLNKWRRPHFFFSKNFISFHPNTWKFTGVCAGRQDHNSEGNHRYRRKASVRKGDS